MIDGDTGQRKRNPKGMFLDRTHGGLHPEQQV
jgi:hypothetical protein